MIMIGILGYATYVYIGRVCRDMITGNAEAMGSMAVGGKSNPSFSLGQKELATSIVIFLVVFSILLLLTLWCYSKVSVFRYYNYFLHAELFLGRLHFPRTCTKRRSLLHQSQLVSIVA